MQRVIQVVRTLSLGVALALSASHAFAAGALAIDTNQGEQYGFAYSYANFGEAQTHALSECGAGCQVVLQFANECAAYAADQANGSTAYGWARATSSGAAQNRAVAECEARGGNSCIVRTWGCEN